MKGTGTAVAEAVGTAHIERVIPQILVSDLGASCAFYAEKLGFIVDFTYGEPAFYAGIQRGDARLHLKHVDKPDPGLAYRKAGGHVSGYFLVDNVDALHAEFTGRGVAFASTLGDKPWGMREFSVEDPDGNVLYFGTDL